MTAMVIGIYRVACGGESVRQPRITSRMLRQAMRNLDHRLRLSRRKPAVDKQINAFWSSQREIRSQAHRRPFYHESHPAERLPEILETLSQSACPWASPTELSKVLVPCMTASGHSGALISVL